MYAEAFLTDVVGNSHQHTIALLKTGYMETGDESPHKVTCLSFVERSCRILSVEKYRLLLVELIRSIEGKSKQICAF